MSLAISNNDNAPVFYEPIDYQDELLVFTGAGTVLEGTLLARKVVDDAITPVADVGNTGDGTCTAAAVVAGPVVPLVGSYNLECIAAVAHGGTFKLVDPNGALLISTLVMTAGAGVATVFKVAGMTFTLTDGATDFIVGDKFAVPLVANEKLVPFAIAGLGGAQIPIAVIGSAIVAAGAGNEPVRPGMRGRLNLNKLVIHADGDNSNIDAAVKDQLKDTGLFVEVVTSSSILDNQ